MHTKVASDFLTWITNKQYLGKLLYVFVAVGNQIFFSTGNQNALNLFQSLKLAVYVKGCLRAWESYVSLSNAKYPSIFISIHQNLQLWQKSYCYLYTAISVPKRWNIFMRNTQAVSKNPKTVFMEEIKWLMREITDSQWPHGLSRWGSPTGNHSSPGVMGTPMALFI